MRDNLESLGEDVVIVSLDVDLNEDEELLRRYAEENGFEWRLAVAPRELASELVQRYGNRFATPPAEPKLFIGPDGSVTEEFGRKSADELRALVDRARGG